MKIKINLLFIGLIAVLSTTILSCGGDDDPTPNPNPEPKDNLLETRKALVQNVANEIIIPYYQALKTASDNLSQAVEDFTQAPDEAKLVTTQTALKETWLAWQDAAIYQFGPAVSVTFRNSMNTYPTDDTQIEENIATGDYILGALDNKAAVGLPAVDYLLHSAAADNAAVVELFLSSANAANRITYLKDLTNSIQSKVESTLNGWLASGDNYVANFTADDALGTDVGSSLGLLVNAIDQHFQRFARDGKVAIPAGVRSAGIPRPKATEAFYAGYSVELLIANLKAYERLYLGIGSNDQDETGLHDYLIELEAEDLANDIKDQFATTIKAAEELSDPLSATIETNLDDVINVFLEMQKLVPLIKTDMASIMGITITNEDNDGD